MTLEEMKKCKKELGYSYEQIAELSGVPLGTVQKVFGGITASPRYETLRALEQVFKSSDTLMIRESAVSYQVKKQGEYTVDDYRALPDDQRMELIDGVLYDMETPTGVHQIIGGRIFTTLSNYIMGKKGRCIPLYSPIDVQLDCDDKTIVQPDVLVLCDRDKLTGNTIYGVPDFIAEVLSKSTRKKDMFLKLNKYMNAGVREYWMIDPEKQKVLVYDFEHDNYPVIYGFDTVVPIAMFAGECEVDFQEIYDYLKSFSLL